MFTFDRDNYIEKMQPIVKKLVASLDVHGIVFKEKDGDLENVVFSLGSIDYKIAWDCFYRISGMSGMMIDIDEKNSDFVEFSSDDWINIYIKHYVLQYFLPDEFGGKKEMVPKEIQIKGVTKTVMAYNAPYFYARGMLYRHCRKKLKR
jgi:hypothetical protein